MNSSMISATVWTKDERQDLVEFVQNMITLIGMDQTRQRLIDTTSNVRDVMRRDSGTCKYWVVIIGLFIVILIVSWIPV